MGSNIGIYSYTDTHTRTRIHSLYLFQSFAVGCGLWSTGIDIARCPLPSECTFRTEGGKQEINDRLEGARRGGRGGGGGGRTLWTRGWKCNGVSSSVCQHGLPIEARRVASKCEPRSERKIVFEHFRRLDGWWVVSKLRSMLVRAELSSLTTKMDRGKCLGENMVYFEMINRVETIDFWKFLSDVG